MAGLESNPGVTIMIVGSLVAASCALVGSFLVLRKMALLGDAVSHAVLPGIVIAFLVTDSRSPLPMIAGAGVLGVVTVFLVGLLNRTRRLYPEASIGVVFPALFSVGVILISHYANQVDLDLDCVMFGELAYVPWDVVFWRGASIGPRALWISGSVFLLDLVLVATFYKELKITTFDAGLATTLGFSPVFMHYLLMSLVSVTVVASFESVGAILVVAMLVVPASAAYLLTNRLFSMICLAVVIGTISAVLGYGVSHQYDCSVAGGMVVVAGALFLAALIFSPEHGLVPKRMRDGRLSRRFDAQLLLLHLGTGGASLPEAAIRERFRWSSSKTRRVLADLVSSGFIVETPDGLAVTTAGAAAIRATGAAGLVR